MTGEKTEAKTGTVIGASETIVTGNYTISIREAVRPWLGGVTLGECFQFRVNDRNEVVLEKAECKRKPRKK